MALLAVPLALIGVACSSNGNSSQPGAGGGQVPGAFAAIPKPSATEPVSAASQSGTSWIQSFKVNGMQPVGVMAFYAQAMPGAGYTATTAAQASGSSDTTATYKSTSTGATVVVTASAFQSGGGGDQTQLNLQYTP